MATTSHALLDCLYEPLDVPNVFICGACVYMRWWWKFSGRFKLIITMVVIDGEPPVIVFFLTFFKPWIISVLHFLLHACTDMKYIYTDLVFRKGIIFTNKKAMDIYTLWWCLEMGGGKGIIGIFCDYLVSSKWPWLGWWVFVVHIWLLIGWCSQFWLGSLLFGLFQQYI